MNEKVNNAMTFSETFLLHQRDIETHMCVHVYVCVCMHVYMYACKEPVYNLRNILSICVT